ncbi:hypothetical protein [Alistipes shahii]
MKFAAFRVNFNIMNKEKINTLDAAQGAGTMSAPESEISNIATVTIDKLNDKDEVVETEELKLEVVDGDTKDWQHTFWNVMWLASRTKPAPTTTWSNEEKAEAIMGYAEDLYADPTLCLRRLLFKARAESRLCRPAHRLRRLLQCAGSYQTWGRGGLRGIYRHVLLADRNLRPRVTGHDNSFNSYLSEGTIQQWIAPSISFIANSASLRRFGSFRNCPSKSV